MLLAMLLHVCVLLLCLVARNRCGWGAVADMRERQGAEQVACEYLEACFCTGSSQTACMLQGGEHAQSYSWHICYTARQANRTHAPLCCVLHGVCCGTRSVMLCVSTCLIMAMTAAHLLHLYRLSSLLAVP